jgi:hypothetical protein
LKTTKEWYKDSYEKSKRRTEDAIRITKLSVMGVCMLTAAMPLAYMAVYEDVMNSLTDNIKNKGDIDGEN